MNPPCVSVVMVTYKENQARLKHAIDSVLNQTFGDLELIIVCETGDPNIAYVEQSYQDERIVIVVNKDAPHRNVCHNLGLAAARGRYLARMDSDDYTYPDRLAMQVEFLRTNPDVALVGAAGRLLDRNGGCAGTRIFPSTHTAIMRKIAFSNPIFHSAVLWDRDIVGRDLRYSMYLLDDLELWLRMVRSGHRLANLPDVLIDYTQPDGYRRPMRNWRCNVEVRALHWRLGLKYPRLLIGLAGFFIMSHLPGRVVDSITGRNWFSDYFRSIHAR